MEVSEVLVVSYTSSLTLSVAGIFKVSYIHSFTMPYLIHFFKELFMVLIAIEWIGDKVSVINVVGLFICLCGILSHVIHKIKTMRPNGSLRAYNIETEKFETAESLLNDPETLSMSSNSESELSDTQVLFDILNRHDR